MPKIVVQGYEADGEEKGKATHKEANQKKLEDWFAANQDKLSLVADQLTKKLGEEKFKNMVLSTPTITWDEVEFSNKGSNKVYLTPKVTFNLAAKDGYALAEGSAATVTLTIRVLYKDSNLTRNVLSTQGAYYTAAPKNAIVDDANVKAKVNVYMNYTGPNIVLDADLPTVGEQENTSINGTSNVEGTFNTKFKNLLVNVLRRGHAESSLLQAIINYVNKFDPKFPAEFVLKTNGVTVASVQNNTQLRIGSLNDFLYNNKGFLQQVNGDSTAVYFAVMGVTSNGWVNTFLIRIPLTKFVRPISVLEEQSAQDQTPEASQQAGGDQSTSSSPQETAQTQSNQGS
ncbi:hemagglutinin [Mycoplasmopsis synoviae]|uniref:hemagglutinin n=1 Tax=Mycoplasmopsis synoviae TaxID=2109 RepID=UPI001CE1C33E|nr:hemagglutinin [Mycoplasmopsis synoviae]